MTPERRRPERSRRIPGLPAWLEAARVRQKAKIFHELDHDTYKIALLPANASLYVTQALTRRKVEPGAGSDWTQPVPDRRSLLQNVALQSGSRH
jgi:hypothetical protein